MYQEKSLILKHWQDDKYKQSDLSKLLQEGFPRYMKLHQDRLCFVTELYVQLRRHLLVFFKYASVTLYFNRELFMYDLSDVGAPKLLWRTHLPFATADCYKSWNVAASAVIIVGRENMCVIDAETGKQRALVPSGGTHAAYYSPKSSSDTSQRSELIALVSDNLLQMVSLDGDVLWKNTIAEGDEVVNNGRNDTQVDINATFVAVHRNSKIYVWTVEGTFVTCVKPVTPSSAHEAVDVDFNFWLQLVHEETHILLCGSYLLASQGSDILVWELPSSSSIATQGGPQQFSAPSFLLDHILTVKQLSRTPFDNVVVSSSQDGMLKTWDLRKGKKIEDFILLYQHQVQVLDSNAFQARRISDFLVSEDHLLAVSYYGKLKMWNIVTGQFLFSMDIPGLSSLTVSDTKLVWLVGDKLMVRDYNVTPEEQQKLRKTQPALRKEIVTIVS
jgi:hypothetical protein